MLSPYAASKHFNEKLAIVYSQFFAVTVTALRYFNVYGERQSPDSHYAAVIPKFLQQFETELPATVFGDGRQTRDFVHVSDVVAANLMASETEDQIPSVLNVCSGREVSLLDILDILRKIFPKSKEPKFHPARPGDVPRSVGDPNLAKKLLGFEANVDLTTGLAESVTA